MQVKITIDNKTILRVLAVIFLFLFGISFIAAAREALTIILISAFLAMALNPPVSYLSSRITGGSRGAATAIAYLLVIGALGLFLWAIIPPLATQTKDFIHDLPTYIDEAGQGDNVIARFIRENDIQEEVQTYVDELSGSRNLSNAGSWIFSGINRIGTALASLLTVLVLTFFMLVEGPYWLNQFWELQPEDKRARRRALGKKMYNVIIGYVNGQLLIALLAAMASLVMMLIIGLPLPLPLAGIVGIFGLVPIVGASLGSITVVIVALFQSVPTAVVMLLFFLTYQQIENSFIQPVIQSRRLNVSPLLVFLAVLLGLNFGGLLGAFVAIPTAACARILINEYVVRERVQKSKKAKKPKKIVTETTVTAD